MPCAWRQPAGDDAAAVIAALAQLPRIFEVSTGFRWDTPCARPHLTVTDGRPWSVCSKEDAQIPLSSRRASRLDMPLSRRLELGAKLRRAQSASSSHRATFASPSTYLIVPASEASRHRGPPELAATGARPLLAILTASESLPPANRPRVRARLYWTVNPDIAQGGCSSPQDG